MAAGGRTLPQPAAHEGHHALPALLLGPPQLVVGRLGDPGPQVGQGLVPVGQDVARQQVGDLGRDPGVGVHAVGDRPDGRLVRLQVGPQVAEHVPAHLAVELGDAVGPPGQAQAHDRHVERLVRRVPGAVAEGYEVADLDPDLVAPAAEVLLHQRQREAVDARGHRGVGGEDAAGPHRLDGLGVAEPVAHHQLADALQAQEPGVALVGVEHLGLDAHGLQRPDPADAQQDLLAQPVLGVAAVEPVGDAAQVVAVLLDVGVEEVQRHPAHVRLPQLRHQRVLVGGQVHLDPHVLTQRERHDVRVEQQVALLLPAVGVEALAEVAVAVEQAHAHQRHAQVARRLEVVAGQDAQAARVLGDGLGDAELGREVGHQAERAVAAGLEPALAVQVALELAADLAQEPLEPGVAGQGVQALAGDQAQQADGVVDARVPQVVVDPAEQVAGLVVPRPSEVERQFLQGRELGREGGPDSEAAQCLHRSRTVVTASRRAPLEGSPGAARSPTVHPPYSEWPGSPRASFPA